MKRSILTDGNGVPLAVVIDGANRHDMKLARATIEGTKIERPEPTEERPQHMCLDKGYDYAEIDALVAEFGFTGHTKRRGEDDSTVKREAGKRARRWVVERTHSWMNRFRGILIRWSKRADTYLAQLHFVLGLITWKPILLPG